MKTKSLSLGFGLMLTILLSITFLFAGCSGKTLSFNKQFEAAAQNYFDARNSYTNFADTTYSLEDSNVEKSKNTLTYEPTGGEEQTLEYDSVVTTTTQTKLYVKRIGEELALKLEVKTTESENYKKFNTETQKVEDVTDTTVIETTYTMAPKTEEAVTSYYILKSVKTTVGNAEPTTTTNYYKFANKAAYQTTITDYLLGQDNVDDYTPISKNISNIFNDLTEVRFYGSFMGGTEEVKEGKNSASYSANIDNFSVYNNAVSKYSFGFDINIKNNKLDNIKTSNTYSSDGEQSTYSSSYSVIDGANAEIAIDTIEGATLVANLSTNMFENFPRVYIEFGM